MILITWQISWDSVESKRVRNQWQWWVIRALNVFGAQHWSDLNR